jgi:hypothetical protein
MRKTAGLIAAAVIAATAFIAAPAHAATGDTISISVSDTAIAGTNVDVVVTVLDTNGNPEVGLQVAGTSTGVGYLSVPTATTDGNGSATLKLYASEFEQGWAYVTAATADATSDPAAINFVAAPSANDSVDSLTLTSAAAKVQAGTTTDLTATALDVDGNPVAGAVVSATSTGAGFLAVASGVTDDNGVAVLKFETANNDEGDAAIFAVAGSAQADELDLTAGVTDADLSIAKHLVTLSYEFAAAKKISIKVDGALLRTVTPTDNEAHAVRFSLKKGSHWVVVKTKGGVLETQKYVVK